MMITTTIAMAGRPSDASSSTSTHLTACRRHAQTFNVIYEYIRHLIDALTHIHSRVYYTEAGMHA